MNYPNYDLENQAKALGYKYVVGVDEVGRGGLAFDVVAAAVYVPEEALPLLEGKVNDSKKLSAKKREFLHDLIRDVCMVGVHNISAEVIDRINILEATKLAMRAAIENLGYFNYILVDGTVDLTKMIKTCPCQQVIAGDSKSISIAAASIVAKVIRDKMVIDIHNELPIYNFAKNKTYGTKEHKEAIRVYGPSIYHRKTFSGVKEYL